MRSAIKSLPAILALSLIGLMSFAATAFAADAAIPADASAVDLLTPVYEAFARGNYIYAGCLVVVAAVALATRYGLVKSRKGKIALAFAGAFAATLATSAAAGTLSLATAWLAFKIGAGAAGGYAVVNELLVQPYLKPLQSKLPAWAQMPLSIFLWIFEKKATSTTGAVETKKAEVAGQAAVDAKPSTGVTSVLGKPVEIE